jgi:hypothetical protein
MASRRDIMTPRKKKDGGTYWVKIGTAWLNDNGSEQLVFDALPLPDSEGRCVANLFEPKPREQAQGNQGGGGWHGKAPEDDGDAIPFARNDTVW